MPKKIGIQSRTLFRPLGEYCGAAGRNGSGTSWSFRGVADFLGEVDPRRPSFPDMLRSSSTSLHDTCSTFTEVASSFLFFQASQFESFSPLALSQRSLPLCFLNVRFLRFWFRVLLATCTFTAILSGFFHLFASAKPIRTLFTQACKKPIGEIFEKQQLWTGNIPDRIEQSISHEIHIF